MIISCVYLALICFAHIGIGIFEDGGFELMAPTTCRNALRVLRAMQLPKPGMLLHLYLNFI